MGCVGVTFAAFAMHNVVEYYWHRLMHHRWFYARLHKIHHHYKSPEVISRNPPNALPRPSRACSAILVIDVFPSEWVTSHAPTAFRRLVHPPSRGSRLLLHTVLSPGRPAHPLGGFCDLRGSHGALWCAGPFWSPCLHPGEALATSPSAPKWWITLELPVLASRRDTRILSLSIPGH